MSLTSILTDTNNQQLRDKFKTNFLTPTFNLKTEIKVSPLTNNWGIVGTAFDYLIRFYLSYHNKDCLIHETTWVADHSYSLLSKKLLETKVIIINSNFYKSKDIIESLSKEYSQAKSNYLKFLLDGLLTDDLMKTTIILAKLDIYLRARIIYHDYADYDSKDINDLFSLISLVNKNSFIAKKECFFNPTFGKGSVLVGGADADLIIDNTLIDVKVTKLLKLKREYINQLIGYYLLSLIGGVNNNPKKKPIKNIGVYFARHGELWTMSIGQLSDKKAIEKFKNWFVHYVSDLK